MYVTIFTCNMVQQISLYPVMSNKKKLVSDIRTSLLVCHLHQNAPERPSSLKDQLPQVGCMSILKGQRSLYLLTRTYVRDYLYQISRNCCKRPNFSFRLCYGKTSRYIQPGFFSYEQNVLVKKEGATTCILLSRWSLVTPKLSALVWIPHFFFLSANWCLQLGKLVYLLMTKQHLVSGGFFGLCRHKHFLLKLVP